MKPQLISKIMLCCVLCLTLLNKTYSQKQTTKDNYEKEWKTVANNEQNGLPKSALETVNDIYKKAKVDKNNEQVIKAIIYKLKFRNEIEEDAYETLLKEIETDIKLADVPTAAFLNSMLAEMYWHYYDANAWKFINRTTVVNFNQDDVKTWDLNKLLQRTIYLYQLSLMNSDELKISLYDNFSQVIVKGNCPENMRPTVYDFLANRAIDFFANTQITINEPADKFELREDFYFSDAKIFANQKIETKDTLSLHFYAIKTLQQLLTYRLSQSNDGALIDVDLKRLKMVHYNSVNDLKDSLYLAALESLTKKYENQNFVADIYFLIAEYYVNKVNPNESYSDNIKTIENQALVKKYNNLAYDICTKIIAQYPKSNAANKCKALQERLNRTELQITCEGAIAAHEKSAIRIAYKNLPKIYIRVATIEQGLLEKLSVKNYNDDLFNALLKKSTKVYDTTIVLPNLKDFDFHSVELLLRPLNLGKYIIFASTGEKFETAKNIVAWELINVTNLSYIIRQNESGEEEFYVMHRQTGEPLANVSAQLWFTKWNQTTSVYDYIKGDKFETNADGYFSVKPKHDDYTYYSGVELKLGDDIYSPFNSFSLYKWRNVPTKEYVIHLFTDRAIYRPGQTVFFKGIELITNGSKPEIAPKVSTKVTFYDHNYKEVSSLDLTSNEYGTFNGQFQIPTGLLNGRFMISTPYGSITIHVEEYKRPKFETQISPMQGNFILNDNVTVKGTAKSYAGSNLTDAKVAYRVVRKPLYNYWWWLKQSETEITSGTTQTNEKGEYEFKFKAAPDLSYPKKPDVTFNYQVAVDVTDINGETQSSTRDLEVGYVALSLSLDCVPLTDKSENKDFKVDINSTNLNGEAINATGLVTVYKLKDNQKVLRDRKWTMPDTSLYTKEQWEKEFAGNVYKNETDITTLEKSENVFSYNFDTSKDKSFKLNNLSNFKNGAYLIEASAVDSFGNPISTKKYFTLFESKSKKPSFVKPDIFVALKANGEPGENARFLVGTAKKNVKLLYEIQRGDSIYSKKWISLSESQQIIEIPILETDRGNFIVYFRMIKNNRYYDHDVLVVVPFTNKELDITFETFRDKLTPGQKEEWKVKIKNKKGDKLLAEMLATMYDASLEVFEKNSWFFNIYHNNDIALFWRTVSFHTSNATVLNNFPYESINIESYDYDHLNWFGFGYSNYRDYDGLSGGGVVKATSAMKSEKMVKFSAPVVVDSETSVEEAPKEIVITGYGTTKSKKDDVPPPPPPGVTITVTAHGNKIDPNKIKVRKNFNETAFFYPQLQTDSTGSLVIKFTMPESLTKWKFMGFAHTKDLVYGFTEKEIITQKDLMILPNLPRFFRESDEIEFSAKISNLSKDALNGKSRIEFFDALTMKPVANIFMNNDQNKDFTIAAGQNFAVAWRLKIPEGISAITYRISAESGAFTDAEESTIPVLSNRMLVTESMPLPMRGKQTRNFEFTKLLNSGSSTTLRHQKLTLEFTSNPAWYAVQALPYIMEYPYECAEQVFSRFYANSLATHIANSSPKIKTVFDSWKSEASKESLMSNLEKNQELKSLLLEETPWVMDAQNEGERKKRVGLLFDLNKMSNELEAAFNKLSKMQSSNGGWSWFVGMPESHYITQHIVCGMGHLDHLGVKKIRDDEKTFDMIKKAINYCDNEIKKDYDDLKRYYESVELKKNHLSAIAIHYLYARSYFTDVEVPKNCREAFDYYKGQAEKYWLTQSKYEQAMIALALHRYENKTVPKAIVKSLKEFSTTSDEMGMYWKDNTAGFYWYEAPIETQALMIEMFDEVANDQPAVNDLKVWLLKQKQTQDWKTTKATVEAIYALLLRGGDWLASDTLVQIKIANQNINPKELPDCKMEAGTGYFKTSWSGTEIKPEMGNITVTKLDNGVSWGAVYWQYFEQLDKITAHETPLKLQKKLFIEKNSDHGKIIEPINDNTLLTVGDKIIVRIELRVDRDMDYVHMKDMRAAGFEPMNVISRYKYQDGLGYYESTKDASTNFFMDRLNKGTYVFEYPLRVSHNGFFSNGITSIQCMYAPEFTSHSEGIKVKVGK